MEAEVRTLPSAPRRRLRGQEHGRLVMPLTVFPFNQGYTAGMPPSRSVRFVLEFLAAMVALVFLIRFR
jgi:hypothetical protein